MAEQTWRVVRIENGKRVILFDDGKEVPMSDEKFHEFKTGMPKSDKEAAKAASAENKTLKDEAAAAKAKAEAAAKAKKGPDETKAVPNAPETK